MNTEYDHNYLPQVAITYRGEEHSGEVPGSLVQVPPSTRLSTRQVIEWTTSGSQAPLCPSAQDGALCVKGPLLLAGKMGLAILGSFCPWHVP